MTYWNRYFNPRSPHGERLRLRIFQRHAPLISIHAPRTGSDELLDDGTALADGFQSTLPARGATRSSPHHTMDVVDFNPRSPHGERHVFIRGWLRNQHFNPRSPHGERQHHFGVHDLCRQFQSTLPARGATIDASHSSMRRFRFQSTLPARGATTPHGFKSRKEHHFNPRSPHGERLRARKGMNTMTRISIHAPRTGSDNRRKLPSTR